MAKQNKKLSASSKPVNKLGEGKESPALMSGDDLAKEALMSASDSGNGAVIDDPDESEDESTDSEIAKSDQLAETLTALQKVIERNADQLTSLQKKLKENREMLRNVYENDAPLQEVQEKVDALAVHLKDRKARIQGNPESIELKNKVGELSEQKKEIEDALSNHLVNYYQLTNSTSFDTSDGDQWEYVIRARVKPRRKRKN